MEIYIKKCVGTQLCNRVKNSTRRSLTSDERLRPTGDHTGPHFICTLLRCFEESMSGILHINQCGRCTQKCILFFLKAFATAAPHRSRSAERRLRRTEDLTCTRPPLTHANKSLTSHRHTVKPQSSCQIWSLGREPAGYSKTMT